MAGAWLRWKLKVGMLQTQTSDGVTAQLARRSLALVHHPWFPLHGAQVTVSGEQTSTTSRTPVPDAALSSSAETDGCVELLLPPVA